MSMPEDLEFELLRRSFLQNLRDTLDKLEESILLIEKQSDKDRKKDLFQKVLSQLHSLKGASAAHEFFNIAKICHEFEDLVSRDIAKGATTNTQLWLKIIDTISDFAKNYIRSDGKINEEDYYNKLFEKKVPAFNEKVLPSILFIDASKVFTNSAAQRLEHYYSKITSCRSGLEALTKVFGGEAFDIIILSRYLKDMKGSTLLNVLALENDRFHGQTIMITSEQSPLPKDQQSPNYVVYKGGEMWQELHLLLKNIIENKNVKKSA